MADTPDFSLMKQQIEEIKALAYDLGVRIRRQWWNDARGSVRETPDAVQLSGMQMTNTPDLDSLRAILAKRTPGEWFFDHGCLWADRAGLSRGKALPVRMFDNDLAAIVAAVNAIGPLLERVRELERRLSVSESECERRGTERLAALGRLSEMEKRLYKEVDAAWCDGQKMAGRDVAYAEAQLAAANERIEELEAENRTIRMQLPRFRRRGRDGGA